ncbi:MAG: cytochrome P450 [Hyphomicrobiales bacterium]
MIEACPAFPMRRISPLDPPPPYAAIRAEGGIARASLWNGTTTWLVTRHEDVRAVLADSETFSTVAHRPGYPMMAPGRAEVLLNERPTFNRLDPPEHTPLRRMLTREFSVKRIQEMRPFLEDTVDRLLEAMERAGPPADLVTALALPLPTMVISHMLGIPYEDHEFFQERTSTKLNLETGPGVSLAAQRDVLAYLDRLMRSKAEADPIPDDLLGRLMKDHVLTGNLSHEDAVQMAEMVIVAGHETTANMITLGTIILQRNPDQLELLRRDRSLMGSAIEEMLRFLTITHFNGARVAVKDTVLCGQEIKAGEGVWALLPAANRDEKVFPAPDQFDITRGAHHHVAFGFGVHQCLGQSLARLELDIVFNRMLDRFPGLELAIPFDDIPFKHDSFVFGVKCLPVAW